ncbi:hypothetical protein ACWEV4_34170, partial [Streptomyces sp. NPDC003860]
GLPVDDLARTPSGRIDRDAADEVFARRRAETERCSMCTPSSRWTWPRSWRRPGTAAPWSPSRSTGAPPASELRWPRR